MKVGLLLEGGAMRGLYSAGVIDVLLENNIKVDDIVAVSAGALFGMNYKSKQKGRVLRYNKKYLNNKDYMGLHSLITTGNIMNEAFCFNRLVYELDPVDFNTYKNNPVNFYAVVTNINTGCAEYPLLDDLSQKNQIEYLRASGSMPFVSKPVMVNHQKYLDGGIADSIPISKMLDMDLDKIIVVLTRIKEYRKKGSNPWIPKLYYHQYPNLVKAINKRYEVYNLQLDLIDALQKENKIFVIQPSRLVNISRVEKDITKVEEMYQLGVNDAMHQLTALKDYLKDSI